MLFCHSIFEKPDGPVDYDRCADCLSVGLRVSRPPPSKPFAIDQAHLRRVRNLARESGRSVLEELEHMNNGTSEELVQQLALMFGMAAIDLPSLLTMTPAFDVLPLTLAQQWRCMLLRDADGVLSGVLADPFDPDLQLWLNNQARGAVLMRIASSTDLRAYLHSWALHERKSEDLPSPSRGLVASRKPDGEAQPLGTPADDAATGQMLAMTRDVLRRAMRRS